MSGRDALRADRARARLLEVAGPDVYRRNPFRITGLRTDASPREVRGRRQLSVGVSTLVGGTPHRDDRLPLPDDPGPDQVRTAFDELGRTGDRLVAELFWWWGEPGDCGCPEAVHRAHDDAVLAHAQVLDLEAGAEPINESKRARLWREAARAWGSALEHEAFWAHVDHRVRRLADRTLDQSTVDGLRAAFVRALLGPQIALASSRGDAELVDLLREWPVGGDVLDDARTLAAQPLVDRMKALIGEFGDLLDQRQLDVMARRAPTELVDAARRLDRALPHGRHLRSARLREQAAVLMNNCALAMMDQRRPDRLRVRALFAEAERLAVDEATRRTIRDNFESFEDGTSDVRFDGIDQMLSRGEFLTVAGLLVRARKTTRDPRKRRQIDDLLGEIRAIRSSGAMRDTSGRSGFLAGTALCLVHMVVVALLLGALGGWGIAVVIVVMLLAFVPCVVVRRRWFLGGPMQWPKAVGVLSVFAGLGGLVGAVALVGPWPVLRSVGFFLLTWFMTRGLSQSVADGWDAR